MVLSVSLVVHRPCINTAWLHPALAERGDIRVSSHVLPFPPVNGLQDPEPTPIKQKTQRLQFEDDFPSSGASLVAQIGKNLLAVQGTELQSLNKEVTLEKAMATHSSILAWRIP